MIDNEFEKVLANLDFECFSKKPTDPEYFKGISPCSLHSGCEFKKCCKKYKKGKRCKKCPNE